MTVSCVRVVTNEFGFDLDYLPSTAEIYPTFEVINNALNPVYVRVVVNNGRFDFGGQNYKDLGAVNGASSKVFSPKMTASPLNKHTNESVEITVKIYKDNTYSQLIGECNFSVDVYWIDKDKCSVFEEYTFKEGDWEGWYAQSSGEKPYQFVSLTNEADIDGSGYSVKMHMDADTSKPMEIGSIYKQLELGYKRFIGFALGFKRLLGSPNSSVRVRYSDFETKVNAPLNKFGYALVSLGGATGTENVYLAGYIDVKVYAHYVINLYIDDIRYYVI